MKLNDEVEINARTTRFTFGEFKSSSKLRV